MKKFMRHVLISLFVSILVGGFICMFLLANPFSPTAQQKSEYYNIALDMYESQNFTLDYPLNCEVTFDGYAGTVFTISSAEQPFTAGITFEFVDNELKSMSTGFNPFCIMEGLKIWAIFIFGGMFISTAIYMIRLFFIFIRRWWGLPHHLLFYIK